MKWSNILCSGVLVWWLATPSTAQDITVMVSRNTSVTAIYLHLPATQLQDMGGEPLLLPPSRNGRAPTFSDGQALAEAAMADAAQILRLDVSGTEVPLAPLPALLHRSDDPLLFETPIDASVASAFCSTPDSPMPGLGSLDLYIGFRADIPLSEAPLALHLAPGATVEQVNLVVFRRGALIFDGQRRVIADDTLPLDPPERLALGWLPVPIAGLLIVYAAFAWRRRSQTESAWTFRAD